MLSAAANAENVFDELRARFNADKGELRLVVLVSPTCPACVGGAQWIQDEVLSEYPDLPIKVYAVWYEMLPSDSKKAYPGAQKFMKDKRVTHYWDKKKSLGKWYKTNVPSDYNKPVMWDAWYLYDKDALWEKTPTKMISWGRTILESRKNLADKMAEITGRKTVASLAPSESH